MGLFSKVISTLSGALAKTKETFVSGLRSLILGRKLDESLIDDVQRMLLEADVGNKATARLIDSARADFRAGRLTESRDLLEHLKRGLKTMLDHDGASGAVPLAVAAGKPTVCLITGINGAGKTTSIAKLTRYLQDQNKTVLLGACDTFRAGAVRQLEIWGERLGVDVVKGNPGADPAAVAFDACKAAIARGVDVVIIDTAGRLQTQDPLMRQLAKIKGVIAKSIPGAPHETLLVLDATTGQNALRQAEEFGKATGTGESGGGVTGIILAKLDGTAKGGVVVAIRAATNIPVKFIGTGERPEDLAPFDPDSFVEAMFSE
ncbi:MAG: signal recognition particle-docking protein FtsY [Phycisphaerales bacterium]|nr:signal recognition particle-docking protein FtsY [Phycisphaerales bacterium]